SSTVGLERTDLESNRIARRDPCRQIRTTSARQIEKQLRLCRSVRPPARPPTADRTAVVRPPSAEPAVHAALLARGCDEHTVSKSSDRNEGDRRTVPENRPGD